jgi:hypothetical protein
MSANGDGTIRSFRVVLVEHPLAQTYCVLGVGCENLFLRNLPVASNAASITNAIKLSSLSCHLAILFIHMLSQTEYHILVL